MQPSISHLWRLSGEALAMTYRSAAGYEARLTTSASLVLSREPVAALNYAIIDDGPQAKDRLYEFAQAVRTRDIPVIFVFTAEAAPQLEPVSLELGLQRADPVPLMVYRPANAPQCTNSFEMVRVKEENHVPPANLVAALGFGLDPDMVNRTFAPPYIHGPGVDLFLARQEGTAVSSVQTVRAGEIVGIWAMATVPHHQRKGAGTALLNHAMAYHCEQGAGLFYLVATPAGRPLYEKIGFRTVSEAAVWLFEPH